MGHRQNHFHQLMLVSVIVLMSQPAMKLLRNI